ncbi:hypothetical protein [Ruthenibacterium lactatiformans]|uniref:phage baseplate protein n=1 Tax=Ruthenibacterium lactatiformans TaxID=1550024 RepID=UPI0024325BB1|nr:hypothetical protein [Ruthenibacterium lactatiformans]
MRTHNPACPSACPYDVGDILQTLNATPPAERWPGTEWVKYEGYFLMGEDKTYHPAGQRGGSATVTLTVEQMPYHVHDMGTAGYHTFETGMKPIPSWTAYGVLNATDTSNLYTWNTNTQAMGNSEPHNNLPPYIAVYIWRRTA